MSELTSTDHAMIQRARERGPVVVTTEDRQTLATLIVWRPTRNGRRTSTARVMFRSGRFATVRVERVALPVTYEGVAG